jgi:hypothetical protein
MSNHLRMPSSLAGAAACLALAAPMSVAKAEPIVGLLGNNLLITFDSATPGTTSAPVAVTGLQAGDMLVGIDLRPSTGVLYGLASDGSLYTVDPGTGAASSIGALSVPFASTNIGIDFNPVPDLTGAASLRVITDAPSNLRVNVNAGAVGTTATDVPLNGAATFLSGVAYTNNDRDPATGTALFGINAGSLYQVTTPNAGTTVLVGSLGSTATGNVGFDVSGATGAAFASFSTASVSNGFYSINLGTGAATLIGTIGNAQAGVLDITARNGALPVAAIPEPETYALMLLGLASVGWASRRRQVEAAGARARLTRLSP